MGTQSRSPAKYIFGLQRLLPLELPLGDNAVFSFIDLFAGIGGTRMAFEELGGQTRTKSPAKLGKRFSPYRTFQIGE